MQRIDRFTRRSLLKSLGVGAGLLPMLEVEYAQAQVPAPRCAFIFCWPNGMLSTSAATGWPAPSATAAGITFKAFQASLEPLRDDLLLLDGIDYRFLRDSRAPENTGHACNPGMLTGALFKAPGTGTSSIVAGGASIDQYIGSSLVNLGYRGLPSLNLGVFVKSTGRLSWRAAGDAVIPATDPYRVFDEIFKGVPASGGTGTPTPDPTVTRNRSMKKSILDTVRKDLTRFNLRVGTEDRKRIEAHLSSIRALELELDRQAMPPVVVGSKPVLPPGVNTAISENFESTTNMMIDIAVAAMAADVTRVVVLQLGDQGNANVILSTLGYKPAGQVGNTGNFNGHHAIAHRNAADKDKVDTWFQS
ncbi:MAG: DUF1552 domain-containing protein, partial [Deltaproteobacteria bacterium]|nr:DUF1552 domain-containing protein [Deltaproteobacteria bacterium]